MSKPTLTVTKADEAMLDQFWNEKPKRPRIVITEVPLPAGAVTCTITCAVCGVRSTIAVDWSGRICRVCRVDLDKTRAAIAAKRAELLTEDEAAFHRWMAVLDALPNDLRARWEKAQNARCDAEQEYWRWSRPNRLRANEDEITRRAAESKVVMEKWRATFENTRRNVANPLHHVVCAEDAYLAALKQNQTARVDYDIALQEIDAARDNGREF